MACEQRFKINHDVIIPNTVVPNLEHTNDASLIAALVICVQTSIPSNDMQNLAALIMEKCSKDGSSEVELHRHHAKSARYQ